MAEGRGLRRNSNGWQLHLLSEFLESSDVVTNTVLGIELIKVVSTKVLIGLIVAEHKINRYQKAVLDRANCTFFPTTSGQTMVLRFEIAVLTAHRRMSNLGQHRIEMTIGRRGFAAATLAGAFMIAWTASRPRGKVLMRRESTHVGAGLGQQSPGSTLGH